ncbi:tyrosine-type recombinase/integrase [Microbispora corallina]|uniref:Site-specific integrase n=2 Tax=Microbispora corallina TaxID=83302 RepID=A0ABQ4GBP3_9ACTN|nr:site-specific integrase [Microbispora corallina]
MSSTFKRCGCRNPDTGKKYGEGKCPKLAQRDHGSWWARYSAPVGPDGKRRQPRIGPFRNKSEAEKGLRAALAKLDAGIIPADRSITVAAYLKQWITGKRSLAESTRSSYQEAIDLYFVPGLGHLKLTDLRETHLDQLYEAMGQINKLPEGEKPSELLRRLLAARARAPKKKLAEGETPGLKRQQPLKASRIHRVHRVMSSALGTAVKQRLIEHNPAEHVELPAARKVRPLVWTPERVARWEETGKVPSPVMVWTPDQCGVFLDTAEARGERLEALFHLVATRGLRRAEACRAMWANVDLDAGTLSVIEGEDDDERLKSETSWRTVALGEANVALLRAWRAKQMRERLAAGETWIDSGRIFTRENGAALDREEYVSDRFAAIVKAADLPPIRFHDLRHCAATLMLAAGVDMKVVSAELGHARYSFTADVYTSVVPQVAAAAAEATTAIIPRRSRRA